MIMHNYLTNLMGILQIKEFVRLWVFHIEGYHALQRQNTEISKQIFSEKEYRGLGPNFHIHASVSDLYIPMIGLPILLEEICRPIQGLYKSITDTWMLKLGLRPRYSQKRNTWMGFSLQCAELNWWLCQEAGLWDGSVKGCIRMRSER